MRMRRLVAGFGAGLLVVGATAAITAPSAQAFGPTSVTMPGSLFLGNAPAATNATTNNTLTDTLTLTTSPSGTVNAGNVVTVNLSGANGPSTGPVGLGANGQIVRSTVQLTGAMSGDVSLKSGNTCTYPATAIGTNSPQGPWATSGTFTATGNGATQVRLKQIFFDDQGNTDGSGPLLGETACAGSANNADYYVSPGVTQTAGSALPGLAKTAPVASTTIFEPLNIVGANATAGPATFQTVPGFVRGGTGPAPAFTPVTVPLTGTVWGANVPVGGFFTEFCNTVGTSCDAVVTNTLTSDASGNMAGSVSAPLGLTTGNRVIKVTQGANTALYGIVVLAQPSITSVPTGGGPGTPIAVTGSNFNPAQTVTVRGTSTPGPPFTATTDAAITTPASGTGTLSTTFTVNDSATTGLLATQGTPGAPNASNPSGFLTWLLNADRCVAYTSNVTGGPGCTTRQNINVSVLQGRLVQRAYVNSTPTVGSANSTATTPIQGTANVNPDAVTVNLGTITVPLAPATIVGNLNDITVTDNRGGSFGWTLSATMPAFTGTPNANTIANNRLTADPNCAPATNATAWDYEATGKTAIAGFDDTLNAPGVTNLAAQNFGSAVNLCIKDTQENATTQTTGGVYNVTSTLTLAVPAFQAADRYTSTITVLLA